MRQLLIAATLVLGVLFLGAVPLQAYPAQNAGVLTWTDPAAIASGLRNAAEPVLAFTADGVQHAMWQADGKLYYASQKPGQDWSAEKRIASGTAPALAVDVTGTLQAIFANSFQGNYEIYHIRLVNGAWSLPKPVSRTSGPSVQPVLVADKTGGLHAAWMDFVADTWTIYIGTWKGDFWSSYPVSNAPGKDPSLAVLADGSLTLAWQRLIAPLDQPAGIFEIFSSERTANGWSIPVNVSERADKRGVDSTGVNVLAGPDGRVHLTWQENERDIMYDFGRGMYWPIPVLVSRSDSVARGPQLAIGDEGILSLAWDEGDHVRVASAPAGSMSWPPPALLRPPVGDQKDVTLIVTGASLTLGWVQTNGDGISTVYESRRVMRSSADLPVKVRIPYLTH
jgi:hypothetical protein